MTGMVCKSDDGFTVELWEGDRKVTLYSDGHLLCIGDALPMQIIDREDASAKDAAEALRWLLEPERNEP